MKRAALLLLGSLALAGCITPYPDLTQSRSPCRTEPGGWCDFVREAAAESYGYAMLSSNAYEDSDTYTRLPQQFVERVVADNDGDGFAYSLFDEYALDEAGQRADIEARVIAFRGSEPGSPKDLIYGSLRSDQIERARVTYREVRAQMDAEGLQELPLITTGHSLGGALATQISIENPGVKAYIFNPSPFYSGDPMAGDTDRISISERGEFLRVLRRYRAPPAAETLVINCGPGSSASDKHSIRKLADCLTWIAAYDAASGAADLLADNGIIKPPAECGLAVKVHPAISNQDETPCIHQVPARPE
ncbi:MAG: hypothetical protein ABJM58_03345 [Alteripontixanthobacter sp.]